MKDLKHFNVECAFYGGTSNGDAKCIGVKIKAQDIHPTKPWVVVADEHDHVTIWDYERNEVLKQFKSSTSGFNREINIFADIRSLRWLDADVLWWNNRYRVDEVVKNRSVLFILGELDMVVINILTDEMHSITADSFKSKEGKILMNCIELVSASLVAIGCSDGCIRIWDWIQNISIRSVRTYKEKVAITHLLSVHADNTWNMSSDSQINSRMIFRSEDGQFFLLNILHSILSSIQDETLCSVIPLDKKKEDKECASISYQPSTDTFTACLSRRRPGQNNDMHIFSWDLSNIKSDIIPLLGKNKVLRSQAGVSHVCTDVPGFSSGTVITCGKDPKINFMNYHTLESTAAKMEERVLNDEYFQNPYKLIHSINLSKLLSGLPEKVKIFHMRIHPLKRNLLFCASNIGLFVISLYASFSNKHVFHTSWGFNTFYSLVNNRIVKSIVHYDGEYLCREPVVELSVSAEPIELKAGDSPSVISPNQSMIDLNTFQMEPGDKLLVNNNGQIIAQVNMSSCVYRLILIKDSMHILLETGHCLDFAFLGNGGKFCLLTDNNIDECSNSNVVLSLSKAIFMKEVVGSCIITHGKVDFKRAESPIAIFGGGPVMCVTFCDMSNTVEYAMFNALPVATSLMPPVSTTNSGMSPNVTLIIPQENNACKYRSAFYEFDTDNVLPTCVSKEIPKFTGIAWDCSYGLCAVVYNSQVEIFILTNDNKMDSLDSFHVGKKDTIVSLKWTNGILFLSTYSCIWFVILNTCHAMKFKIATHDGVFGSLQQSQHHDIQSHILPNPLNRPIGNLQILNFIDDNLLFLHGESQCFVMSLNRPAVQFFLLLGLHKVESAIECAIKITASNIQDEVALILLQYGHYRHALALPKLSKSMFLSILAEILSTPTCIDDDTSVHTKKIKDTIFGINSQDLISTLEHTDMQQSRPLDKLFSFIPLANDTVFSITSRI